MTTYLPRLRPLLWMLLLAVILALVSAQHVYATDSVSVDGEEPTAWIVVAPNVVLLVATFIPIVTGWLTKYTLPSWAKLLITAVLNAVSALLVVSKQADGTALISNATLMTWLTGLGTSLAAYHWGWKKVGVTSSEPDGKLAPGKGLGA